MMLDEPFAGVDPIAVHDIQKIVAELRYRGIGVLISDHNVEQTLDIVDRAYIMFDGQVQVAGHGARAGLRRRRCREIYLGPTLTARLRARFARAPPRRRPRHEDRACSRAPRSGRSSRSIHACTRRWICSTCPCSTCSSTSSRSCSINPFLELVEPEDEDSGGGDDDSEEAGAREPRGGRDRRRRRSRRSPATTTSTGRRSSSTASRPAGMREERERARVLRAGHRGDARPRRPPQGPDRAARPHAAAGAARRGVHRQHQRGRLPRRVARRDPRRRSTRCSRRPPRSDGSSAQPPLFTDRRGRGDARASSRSSIRRASARATCASACCCSCASSGARGHARVAPRATTPSRS